MNSIDSDLPILMSIIELGGYPDFSDLYQSLGYRVVIMQSMRKALKFIKKNRVRIIVAEFNFQSDFRDRTSQLETLMASIAQQVNVEVIVLYDQEQGHQLKKVTDRFRFLGIFSYPLNEEKLRKTLESVEN